MKQFLILLLACSFCLPSFSQAIKHEDFKEIIPLLKGEKYREAFTESRRLLDSTAKDSSLLRAFVSYMSIISAAGMVSVNQMDREQFAQYAEGFVGQPLIMPAHPCIDSSAKGFNSFQFINSNGAPEGMTIATNSKATNILLFEYYHYDEKPDVSKFLGQTVRAGGFLNKVEVNPRDSGIWIARLYLRNAFTIIAKP
ncbi:MAG TPA: hypothetical protein VFR58_05815 [Flavisolibacter sp.]|nr:hypothetical protein [Flavisolibacter sp.]